MRNIKNRLIIGSVTALAAMTGLTGCAWSRSKEARDTGRTSVQVADDNHISDRVRSSLKLSPVYKFAGVGVTTYDRVVQLNGFVQTDNQKRAAEEIASQAPGAVRVINDIVVQQPQAQSAEAQPASPAGRTSATQARHEPSGS